MATKTFQERGRVLSAPEARACPFCGGRPVIRPWHGGGPRKRIVACEEVDCEANPQVVGATRARALANWNRRHGAE